jgi:natural product biosynthesis luciferase-like monooxygenase protein
MTPSTPLSSVFIGGQSLLIQCADRFKKRGHDIRTIVSSDSNVQRWAKEQDIRCIVPVRDLAAQLAVTPFDYLFSVAYLSVISPAVLALPRRGAINFHDGPLPDYAGLNVTSWALLNKEREHGVTWHVMSERVDEGDILEQVRFPIAAEETALTLNAKCYQAALASFDDLLEALTNGRIHPRRQDLARRRYYAKDRRPEAAGSIDWSSPAADIAALVRGLNFGPYPNPLTTAKAWLGDLPVAVRRIEVLESMALPPGGSVVAMGPEGLTVSTGTNDVVLSELATLLGSPLSARDLEETCGLNEGGSFQSLGADRSRALSELAAGICKHEDFWLGRLAGLESIEIPFVRGRAGNAPQARHQTKHVATPSSFLSRFETAPGDTLLAAFLAYLSRIGGKREFTVPFRHEGLERISAEGAGLFSPHVPLRVSIDASADFGAFRQGLLEELALLRKRGTYALDVAQRHPGIGAAVRNWHESVPAIVVERVPSAASPSSHSDTELTTIIPDDGRCLSFCYREDVLDARTLSRMEGQFIAFLDDLLRGGKRLRELTILSSEERELLFWEWNRTDVRWERDRCVHHLFEAQVRRTPNATGLVFCNEEISYAELNARANQVAHHLIGQGVRPGALVGVLMNRSADLIVGMLAILKAGAAYVPLDPDYPKDRLAYMVEDARLSAILSQSAYQSFLPEASIPVITLDRARAFEGEIVSNPQTKVRPEDLAYVIYTSGSTGKPKGVMVEHRNVVNFFAGMDARLDCEKPGTWLAVTSISFDISVLEIFWTLARGFKVVLYGGEEIASRASPPRKSRRADSGIGFSLFYFASDEGEKGRDKYSLLLEGARFADRNGFEAVWTPERHFHAFGGLYPNPSLAGAAIAAITERVKIRAGSCVLPLHSPIRIAEEWALVDNLSNGRVGVSFASGWQPGDFALAPDAYQERHKIFRSGIETVRALWRGDSRTFRGPKGEVEVRTLPRPVQPELPFWMTAAGNPETFRQAGQMGANMLTHLLGQSIEQLAEKLAIYRQAFGEAGHPGRGSVTLMLHTFVAQDEAFVRAQVHGPFKNYLRSSTDLLKQHASSFPAFRNAGRESIDGLFQKLSDSDIEALLEHAFARYYETSGLFGTPQGCLAMVERLKGIGVDEIACLIDFGVPSEIVMAQLSHLNELRQLANSPSAMREVDGDQSLAALLAQHEVTHLQVTPSMAAMLVKSENACATLRGLKNLLVGGEAFPRELAADLTGLVSGRVINMYGPTETTVWSATHDVADASRSIPVGRPIGNTQIYIFDENLQLAPIGVAGELVIGGEGVVRGYLNRPELTAERFIPDPFRPGKRLYRTGDQARWREDGVLEFLGRLDDQVKIRGHRIELGEIEAVLARHPAIRQSVVVARGETPGDKRLVAYLIAETGRAPTVNELRDHLLRELPDFMVPAAFVTLGAFPLTPNNKVDRKRLPAPGSSRPALRREFVAPRTPNEAILAGFFQEVLGFGEVGIFDNFIELGGDSLSAVEVFVKIEQTFSVPFPLSLFFKVPTIAGLAKELERIIGDACRRETSPGAAAPDRGGALVLAPEAVLSNDSRSARGNGERADRFDVLRAAPEEEWLSVLRRCSAMHDVYHLPGYHAVAERHGEGEARLFAYEQAGYTIALPLIIRTLADLRGIGASANTWRDATSVYGYSGPICSHKEMPRAVIEGFQRGLITALQELQVVSVFSRLHPLLPEQAPLLQGIGEYQLGGTTVSINLSDAPVEQRAQYGGSIRNRLNRLARLGVTCALDPEQRHLPEFVALYHETMRRVKAEESYFFDPMYFSDLAKNLGPALKLFVVKMRDGEVISGGLFTLCEGIVQYHLGGTRDTALKLSPMVLLFETVRHWANENRAHTFHLGGGVGAKPDSLFRFKARFSRQRHQFATWRWVVAAEAYRELSMQKDRWNSKCGLHAISASFFPAYRCPAEPDDDSAEELGRCRDALLRSRIFAS